MHADIIQENNPTHKVI